MNVKPIELRKIAKKAWKVFRELTYVLPLRLTLEVGLCFARGSVSVCEVLPPGQKQCESPRYHYHQQCLYLSPSYAGKWPDICCFSAVLQINMHCYTAASSTFMLAALYSRDSFKSQSGTLQCLRIAVLITKIN